MNFLLLLFIEAGVLMLAARLLPDVEVKSYGKALIVALLVGILNATIGFLLRLPLNIVTLGLLSFFVRLLVTAVVIKIVDKLMTSFNVRGFSTALLLAFILALTGTFASYFLGIY